MNVPQSVSTDKSPTAASGESPSESPQNLQDLMALAGQLDAFVVAAAQQGMSLYDAEKSVLAAVLKMGHVAVETLLQLQGDGDLGSTVETEAGQTLIRSPEPEQRPLRTVFGEHVFRAYVYRPGPKKKIALRPIDARLNLPAGKGSYLWEEFSQYFCVEQAFGQAAAALEKVLGPKLSVDTLERTNQRVGDQAETFLEELPSVPPEEEGELLVATADGKGVPLIRKEAEAPPPAYGPKPSRPGNRRMATVASVYSVDRHVRTPDDVLAALFRDERPAPEDKTPRPRPCHKRMTACFPTQADDGSEDGLRIRGDVRAWTWAAEEIDARRCKGQVLLRLCDGQESLWNSSDICLGLDLEAPDLEAGENAPSTGPTTAGPATAEPPAAENVVDILDILHVCSYVWSAARAFYASNEARAERFVRKRLLRILRGQAAGVIRGMRSMASRRKLKGKSLKSVTTTCNYFQNNLHRMRYDEYLKQGYPIASGVIEGACRHLVKDRMERSGMRWDQENAGAMLFVRALKVTGLWDDFQQHRQSAEQCRLHPHRQQLVNYTPHHLAA